MLLPSVLLPFLSAVLLSDTDSEEMTVLHLGFEEDWAAALWGRGLLAVPRF